MAPLLGFEVVNAVNGIDNVQELRYSKPNTWAQACSILSKLTDGELNVLFDGLRGNNRLFGCLTDEIARRNVGLFNS
jgi:hypothetical protein